MFQKNYRHQNKAQATINTHITKPNTFEINSRNSENDLIDFLENTHIKQETHDNEKEKQIEELQIKMLEEFCMTSKEIHKKTEFQDAELNLFLDKYEYNSKPETPTAKLKYEDIVALEQKPVVPDRFDKARTYICETPKLLVPSLQPEPKSEDYTYNETPKLLDSRLQPEAKSEDHDEELNLDEDLIEEVLFEQQIERQLAKEKPINNEIKKQTTEKIPIAYQTSSHTKTYNDNNIFDEIINKNKVNFFVKPTHTINEKNAAKLTAPITNSKSTNNAFKTTNSNQKAFIYELVTKHDIKYLETVKRVEKVFQKRNVLKSEVEKSKLTPGPSLYEKAVFLPQIMQSISEKQKKYNKNTIKLRLILDSGPSCSRDFENTRSSKSSNSSSAEIDPFNNLPSPQVVMADCNRERLKAFETKKLFNNYVCNGYFPR